MLGGPYAWCSCLLDAAIESCPATACTLVPCTLQPACGVLFSIMHIMYALLALSLQAPRMASRASFTQSRRAAQAARHSLPAPLRAAATSQSASTSSPATWEAPMAAMGFCLPIAVSLRPCSCLTASAMSCLHEYVQPISLHLVKLIAPRPCALLLSYRGQWPVHRDPAGRWVNGKRRSWGGQPLQHSSGVLQREANRGDLACSTVQSGLSSRL